ncbi:hypothetical protein FQN57_001874 [Myotisia sp. PD_48]|nr:hypothetical protein FQN57_001874 [Myotisia sp. PD_48]
MTTYSTLVPHDIVKQSGSRTRFPTAVHQDHALCLEAAHRLQDDFSSTVDVDVDLKSKTIGDYPMLGFAHLVAFAIPECLPERLAIMTRFTDFTILNDDYYGVADIKKVAAFNAGLQRSLQGPKDPISDGTGVAIKTKQFQASILVEMIAIDHSLAMDVMTTYSNGLQITTSPPSGISSIEEYLPIRLVDCGLDVFQDMSCFGIGIRLTQAEKAKLSEVINTALYSAALMNDYYSWPKELKHHLETQGSEIPFSAVCILMRQYKCSDIEALEKLQDKYVELQEQHLLLVRRLEQSEGVISDSHRKYIMAAQYTASGAEFWSNSVPRYPTKEALKQPECLLVDGVFRWRYVLASDHPEDKPVATNGVKISQVNETVAPGIPSPEVTDRNANGVDGSEHGNGCIGNDTRHLLKKPSDEAVRAPYDYINALPSKKVREIFIDGLDSWLEVPATSSSSIKSIIGMLHHASLMLDDIEDNSMLRRGNPTAHVLFGAAQTINSANYIFVCAFEKLQQLQSPHAVGVFIEELKNLHCGQALDLHWKYHTHLPTIEEYITMVDHKTGGLFRLCVRLMQGESSMKSEHIDSGRFVTLLGRYFQIRDDYQNLMSDEYANQKGFCEDLDEGKISLPLIHCLTGSDPEQIMIKGILQHKRAGEMPMELKRLILARMKKGGALNSTYLLLQDMQEDILKELRLLEAEFGSKNPLLELVLRRLWV